MMAPWTLWVSGAMRPALRNATAAAKTLHVFTGGTETIKVLRLPTLSPKWPDRSPPSGRAMKTTGNVLNAARVPADGARLREELLIEDARRGDAV